MCLFCFEASPEEKEESVCMYMAVCLSVDEFAKQS